MHAAHHLFLQQIHVCFLENCLSCIVQQQFIQAKNVSPDFCSFHNVLVDHVLDVFLANCNIYLQINMLVLTLPKVVFTTCI